VRVNRSEVDYRESLATRGAAYEDTRPPSLSEFARIRNRARYRARLKSERMSNVLAAQLEKRARPQRHGAVSSRAPF